MLPSLVSEFLPHFGLLLILVGIVFAVLATTSVPSDLTTAKAKDLSTALKYKTLSYVCVAAGGFVLVGPFHG